MPRIGQSELTWSKHATDLQLQCRAGLAQGRVDRLTAVKKFIGIDLSVKFGDMMIEHQNTF